MRDGDSPERKAAFKRNLSLPREAQLEFGPPSAAGRDDYIASNRRALRNLTKGRNVARKSENWNPVPARGLLDGADAWIS
jgi:hypothetical protein